MQSDRSKSFRCQRRHSASSAAIWPWQVATSPPGRPSSSRAACPKRPHTQDTLDQQQIRRAIGCDREGKVEAGKEETTAEGVPASGVASSSRLGKTADETADGVRVAYATENPVRQEENWVPLSKKERRRQWLNRRRSGNFYFRSEFKGLVHAVMESRGWRPSCPPRVPNEDLTTPYVDSWEENGDALVYARTHGGVSRLRQPCVLPEIACASDAEGTDDVVGPVTNGAISTSKASQEPENDGLPPSERSIQTWDLHWSYTKWAVETMRFARNLAPWQKVNHFRNSNELCRKDLMLKNLKKCRAQLYARGELAEAKEYNFFPDYALFVEEFKESGGIWVMKPSGAAEGKGIFLFTNLSEVKAWAKPHLVRQMKRRDPGNPGSYVVQRYISNPFVIGGKKFDLRLYVLVTSFRPLTVYIYRDGFAKFSSTRFRRARHADPAHLANELMHLTNHAVQRRGAAVGRKWNLKKFKLHVAMRHGRRAMDKLFWDIQALVVRTIRAVDRLVIQDRQSFELFGYDVIVDENLRPWLLEVNASPSLGASNREDLRLKKQMVADVLDIVDVEGRRGKHFWNAVPFPAGSCVREHVGGFDLAFHDGHVEIQPQVCGYSSLFGAVVRNPLKHAWRHKRDKGKFSVFPVPRATPKVTSPANNQVATTHGMSDDALGLDQWRPNIFIFRPQDYWAGLVDYTPCQMHGDGDDGD
ncbi:unnamed protein product, partial [Scytosiphon promiscuus]